MPVSALIATSETPKRMPAAAPSMTPWCSSGAPTRGPMISRPPRPNRPASKAIIAATEKAECAPGSRERDGEQQRGPAAVRATPIHWRRPTSKPKSAVGQDGDEHDAAGEDDLDHARAARAPARRRGGPTRRWPTSMPSANHFDENSGSPSAAGGGRRPWAPRWRRGACRRSRGSRRRRSASARRMPSSRVIEVGAVRGALRWNRLMREAALLPAPDSLGGSAVAGEYPAHTCVED